MIKVALFVLVALLESTAAAPPKHDIGDRPNFSLVATNEKTDNASLVENFLDQPIFEVPAIVQKPAAGIQPIQWPIPEIFKRQAACSNYCGPSQSAPRTYCGCGQQCCGTGCCATASGQVCCAGGNGCCNTAAGAICCGTACCTNGATCNGSRGCEFRTTVITRVATSTTWFYRDITTTVSANGGTATITSTFRSVAVVTVSTAEVATIIATATVTPGAAKRALPAPTSELPQQTLSSPPRLHASRAQIGHDQEVLAPQITQSPLTLQHVAKRQVNNIVSTVTSVVSTITVSSTSTRLVTTTVAARATATYSTTIWSTVTNFVNAKSSTTITTTLVLTPGVSVVNVVTVTDGSGGGNNGGNGGGSNGDNNGGNGEKGSDNNTGNSSQSNSKSLSTGAKAGIGAGTAGGSLIICIILGFWFWRRRKSREEKNREMIDNAVTSAMAAQSQRQSEIQPGRTYYDGKHVSVSASTVSPLPYSPSPEVLSPQPQYVYPAPPGHGHLQQQGQQRQMYNNAGPMGFAESGMEQQQYRYSAQGFGGSEIEGSPVQRYELAQFSSPPPQNVTPHAAVPHPGVYGNGEPEMDLGPGHGRPVYSDLPEVQRSDLPEVRR